MNTTLSVRAPYSILLIMDFEFGEVPENFFGQPCAIANSCIAVATMSADDGATKVLFTDDASAIGNSLIQLYTGVLDTPSKVVSLANAHNEQLATASVGATNVRIQVLANVMREPSEIVVFVQRTE